MSKVALDFFGQFLMTKVRDRAIHHWDKVLRKEMKGGNAMAVYEKIGQLNQDQIDLIEWLVPQIVNTTLHHTLWSIEEEDNVHLTVTMDSGETVEIKEVSDGLPGELYTEGGWIRRFSQERYEEFF